MSKLSPNNALPSESQETQSMDESLLCRYAYVKCNQPRDKKRNGDLHSYCKVHRENANRNQRNFNRRQQIAGKQANAQSMNAEERRKMLEEQINNEIDFAFGQVEPSQVPMKLGDEVRSFLEYVDLEDDEDFDEYDYDETQDNSNNSPDQSAIV